MEEGDLDAHQAEPLPDQINQVEKGVEKVEDAIAESMPNNKLGDEVKEVVSDVKTLEQKIVKEGVGAEVAGIVAEDL